MEDKIYVPYTDFVKGIEARERLAALKDLLEKGKAYASEEVYAILGIEKEENR